MSRNLFSLLMFSLVLVGSWNIALDANAQAMRKRTDPAFDRFITQDSIDTAVNSGDPHEMIDAAMHLAEGERVLHRTHSGISAEDMMISAARVAARKGDADSIDRLKKAADNTGHRNVIPKIDRIARSEKKIELDPAPNFEFRNDQERSAAHGMIDSINHAVITQDRRHLDDTERAGKELGKLFSDKVTQGLDKFLQNAKAKIDDRDDHRNRNHDDYDPARDYRDSGGWGQHPTNDRPDRPDRSQGGEGFGGGAGSGGPGFGSGAIAINDPNNGYNSVYESRRLKAQFVVDPKGARITYIHHWSPLRDKLDVGDVITELDGMRVNSSWELENHVGPTIVDYVTHRHGAHRRTKIHIH